MTIETIIRNLRNIVDELQEATDGEQLDDVKAPVKMLFEDICQVLNIDPELIGL